MIEFHISNFKLRFSAYNFLVVIVILLLLPSCYNKRLALVKNENEIPDSVYKYLSQHVDYYIQNFDNLSIKFFSSNPEVVDLLNMNSSLLQTSNSNASFGYIVSASGSVFIPVLGELKISGLTISQVSKLVQHHLDLHFDNAKVIVELLDFRFYCIGEFNKNGLITTRLQQLNVLQAISLAGGVSDFGDRKNILILRPKAIGYETFKIDITTRDLLATTSFVILPNDIIYIEPVKFKAFRLGVSEYSFVITTISTLLTTVFFYLSLAK